MTDTECLDWLDANTERLREVYWYIENEGGTVRDAVRNAISVLARLQAEESDSLS